MNLRKSALLPSVAALSLASLALAESINPPTRQQTSPAMTEPVGHGPATTEVRPGKKTASRRKTKRGNAL